MTVFISNISLKFRYIFMFNEAFHRNDSNLAQDCMDKWKNLIDQWRKKYNKSGSAGTPISERVVQWRFYDRLSFLKEYIVNRK